MPSGPPPSLGVSSHKRPGHAEPHHGRHTPTPQPNRWIEAQTQTFEPRYACCRRFGHGAIVSVCRRGSRRTGPRSSALVCNACEVIFGDSLRAAESTGPAEWIAATLRGQPGTVAALVPNVYESALRLQAPAPTPDGWWQLYRDLFEFVGSVGARHTTTPIRAWFAIWEGHGFCPSITRLGWRDPPADAAGRGSRESERGRQLEADLDRTATIGPALALVPRFDLPGRTYYLVGGSLDALTDLRYPDDDGWRNPDLFWPSDRAWFAATDVDIWSLYVGGSNAFISELKTHAPTDCELVENGDQLQIEE